MNISDCTHFTPDKAVENLRACLPHARDADSIETLVAEITKYRRIADLKSVAQTIPVETTDSAPGAEIRGRRGPPSGALHWRHAGAAGR